MGETTARDAAWAAIITHLQDHDYVRTSDLDLDETQRRTALRVLRSMEDMGLVQRETPEAQTWYPTDRLAGVTTA